MKNLFKFFVPAVAATVALASCEKEAENPAVQTPEPEAITIRVKAQAEAIKGETKTYIDNNAILWGTDEYMKLALTAGGTTTFATSTDASANTFDGDPEAMFEFSVTPEAASEYVYQGLYPASAAVTSSNTNAANYKVNLPAIQNATASSYDPAAYIMVAKPETFSAVQTDWVASFLRGTALNKITLKNVPSGVSFNKVKITAEGKKLAGGRHFNLTTGEGLEVYGTDASIEVLYATAISGTNVDVWFTSWDTEIAAGEKLTIIAYTTDSKSYTKEITVPDGKTIKFSEGYLNTLGANLEGISPENVASLDGDYVILAKNNTTYYALKGEASGTRIASVDYTGLTSSYSGDASLIWTIATSGSGYTIKNGSNFIGWTSGNTADLVDENDYDATKCLMGIDDNGDGTYKIYVAADATRILAKNTSNAYFGFYTGSGYNALVLVPATAMEQVKTPTFDPAAGEVTSGDQVTISCATSGATIHYTVDGTDPTSSSATYSSPIEITATTTIKAIAVKDGMADSEIATATYSVASAGSVTLTSSDITAGSNTVEGTNNSVLAYRLGTSSNNGSLTFPAGYSSITFTLAGWASGTRSFSITNGTINGDDSLSPAAGSPSGTINAGFSSSYTGTEYTIDVDDPTQEVVFSGRRCVVWGFTAVESTPDTRLDAELSWSTDAASATIDDGDVITFTAPTLDNSNGVAPVTYESTDTDVATVSATGEVTILAAGTTTINAIFAGDVDYKPQTVGYTLTVTDNRTPVVSYDFETVADLNAIVTSTSAQYSGYLTNAVVSFVPATNTAIIKDATGSVMFYKSGHGLKQGQTYTGAINVTAIKYNSLYSEITVWDAAFTGEEAAVSPESVSLADLIGNYDDYQNAYVQVAGLTVSSVDGKNIHVTDGANSYVVYDNPGTATCGAGDVITAVGTITKYSTTEELKIWDASAITITAVAPKAITFSQPSQAGCSISVSAGGSSITSGTTVASGTTVTISASAGTGYNFSSWTVNGATVADASAATTTFTMGTSAVSISASFSTIGGGTVKKYVKVTSGAIGGEYLIVRESSSYIYDGSLSNPDAANNYQTASDLSSLDYDTWKAYAVTIEAYESGYSIKTAAGNYIGRNANSNGIDSATSPTSPNYVNTISFASNGTVTIIGNGGRKFNFNSSSGKFRYFASGNTTEIYLYQLQEVSE